MMDAFDSWEESNGYIAEDAARLRRAWNAGELHAQDRIDALTEERNSLQSKLTESALQVLAHSTQAHEHWEDAQRYQFLRNQPRRKNYYTEEANLRAMCQRCHLTYDADHHRHTAYATRKAAANTADLFA